MHPKHHIYQDKAYLKWIRQKPCLVCRKEGPNDAHHVWHTGRKNGGNDGLAVPLCREHHTANKFSYHELEHDKFEDLWNIDLKDEIICFLLEYLEHIKGSK